MRVFHITGDQYSELETSPDAARWTVHHAEPAGFDMNGVSVLLGAGPGGLPFPGQTQMDNVQFGPCP